MSKILLCGNGKVTDKTLYNLLLNLEDIDHTATIESSPVAEAFAYSTEVGSIESTWTWCSEINCNKEVAKQITDAVINSNDVIQMSVFEK